jgi:predicted transcriptional regulator of viral defense system
MEFSELLRLVGDEPVFETSLLLAGSATRADVQRQLSRWVSNGRLYQLRRGLYAFAPPYAKVKPHPFLVANALVRGSYVSCQSALAHFGLIPEYVAASVSVCAGRPAVWNTPLGRFEFRHIKPAWLSGYTKIEVAQRQFAFVARLEKALLDLVHLQPGGDSPHHLRELRLQNLDRLDMAELHRMAEASDSPKLIRAAREIADLIREDVTAYKPI